MFSDAAVRRLGWLLDKLGDGVPDEIADYCASLASEPSFVPSSSDRVGKLDVKWHIVINEEADLDI